MSSRHVFETCLQDVFTITIFVFQDVFKTSCEMSSRRLQDVFKTSWKTKNCYTEDVLKTSSRRLEHQQMSAEYFNLKSSIISFLYSENIYLSLGISFSCSFVTISELFCFEFYERLEILLVILLPIKSLVASAAF